MGEQQRPTTNRDPQRALIYGWGASGQGAAKLLARGGTQLIAVDDRERPSGDLLNASHYGPDLKSLPEVELVVVSPGVPFDRALLCAARAAGVPVIGELELAARHVEGDLVAITGSNGKSTTTELVGALLRAAGCRTSVCGNIGVPLSEAVVLEDEQPGRVSVFVVEVSSFQLETIDRFRPRVAALLNLSADHLDRHTSLQEYLKVKQRLFARQTADDVAVLNADDPAVASTELPTGVRRRLFSRQRSVADGACLERAGKASPSGMLKDDRILVLQPRLRQVLDVSELRIRGEHNVENALAACAIADAYVTEDASRSFGIALRAFAGLPHRLQEIVRHRGVTWFDDSKGTNVGATLKSLAGFPDGTVHLIAGGTPKGQDFTPLREAVAAKAASVQLIGQAASELANAFEGLSVPVRLCETLDVAVDRAARAARSGDVVVLSPACASFDQFRGYAHRGQVFQELVRSLTSTQAAN